ncbi:hypothetical protein SALBM217S_09964 [Streptomyces griseoloalbus]
MTAPHTDVEQVEAANTAFYEALERGDFEEVASAWLTPSDLGVDESYHDPADTGVVSCVHPGWPVLTGRGEVLRSYALIMANTDYIQFFLTDVHVSVTGDTALVTCTENILSGGPAPEAGEELGPLVGQLVVATNVYRRTRPAGSSGPTTLPGPRRGRRRGRRHPDPALTRVRGGSHPAGHGRRGTRPPRVDSREGRGAVRTGHRPAGPTTAGVIRVDRVALSGLRARGHHGVFPKEREEGQTFLVDLVLGLDTRPAAADDDLTKTVHYGIVAEEVVAVVEGEPVNLVETLAERIAQVCLKHDVVQEVEVRVHKPDAPITVPFDDVTVTITRSRA